jgi:NAD-dependent deacetylase
MPDAIAVLAALLDEDRSTLFITGAGISADSGLPTYRGVGGLYDDAGTDDGIPIEEALSGPMFRRDPGLTWKYIRQIEEACRGAEPNRAHRVLATLEQRLSRVVVLTQNVDGLHARAGSEEVIAIHGTVHDLHCTRCSWADTVADYSAMPPLPTCPSCGGVVRPNVVLFGEMLPVGAVGRLESELATGFDVVVSMGTSSLFPYIAAPVYLARQQGGQTFEVNPGRTEVSNAVHHRIETGAAAAMGALSDAMGLGV